MPQPDKLDQTVKCYTFEGDLETVKKILDSERHQSICKTLEVTRSYWEGRDCLRLDIYSSFHILKICSIHVSVTEETVTLFADGQNTHREVLASIVDQIPNGAIYSEQKMHCCIRHNK